MIPQEAKDLIARFSLGILATVTAEGKAAASPKGTFLVLGDATLAYGDIRSPGSRANIAANGSCEVVFVDPFKRKGYRIAGTARISEEDELYALRPKWRAVWGDLAERIGAIVIISVERCTEITTPPYDDGATEDEMIALYKAKYAEIYP